MEEQDSAGGWGASSRASCRGRTTRRSCAGCSPRRQGASAPNPHRPPNTTTRSARPSGASPPPTRESPERQLALVLVRPRGASADPAAGDNCATTGAAACWRLLERLLAQGSRRSPPTTRRRRWGWPSWRSRWPSGSTRATTARRGSATSGQALAALGGARRLAGDFAGARLAFSQARINLGMGTGDLLEEACWAAWSRYPRPRPGHGRPLSLRTPWRPLPAIGDHHLEGMTLPFQAESGLKRRAGAGGQG